MARTAPVRFASVDEYLAKQPPATQAVLARVRATLRAALPGAEEVISYQIPAYRLPGGVVLYFAGWKEHFSVYPATEAVVTALAAELAPYERSKGTIRFPLGQRVPVRLLTRIARLRAAEHAEKQAAKRPTAKAAPPRASRPAKAAAARPPSARRRAR